MQTIQKELDIHRALRAAFVGLQPQRRKTIPSTNEQTNEQTNKETSHYFVPKIKSVNIEKITKFFRLQGRIRFSGPIRS